MKALISIEFSEEDYGRVSSALRALSYQCKNYDVIIKKNGKITTRTVKGKSLLDLKRAEAINKRSRIYNEL